MTDEVFPRVISLFMINKFCSLVPYDRKNQKGKL